MALLAPPLGCWRRWAAEGSGDLRAHHPSPASVPSAPPQAKACGGLDGKLDGTGGNAWSLGQQQLMCLARAALKKVPVLCLDEATAAMDPHTEAEVLEIIERLFADRTTFTIAHRLDNVIRSDQVRG